VNPRAYLCYNSLMAGFIKKHQYVLLLFLILCIAGFFRFYKLDTVPAGLYPDVAINGVNAIQAIETGDFKVFYPDNNGREGFFINLLALSMMAFGETAWSLKAVAAVIGLLTVLGIYLLAKELFTHPSILRKYYLNPESIALLSAFFTAVSFWHVNFSRIGFRAIMVPFVMVFLFYFLYRALRTGRTIDFLASGLFLGLGLHTYISFRIAPLILAVPFFVEITLYNKKNFKKMKELFREGWLAVTKKFYIEDGWYKWDLMFLVALLVALPLLSYFMANPADFLGRSTQVSVFQSAQPIQTLALSTIKTLGQFNIAGDYNWRHNYAGDPELFWPVGILFLLGLYVLVREILRKPFTLNDHSYLLLLTWLVVMLVPSFLSSEGIPHALRSIGAIPPAMIIAGIGGVWLYNILEIQNPKMKSSLLAASGILLVLICYHGYTRYFDDWANNPNVYAAFNQNYVEVGTFLNSLPAEMKKYVIVNAGGVLVKGIPMPAETVMFVAHGQKNISYLVPGAARSAETPQGATEVKSGSILVPLEKDRALLETFKSYLQGSTIKISGDIQYLEF